MVFFSLIQTQTFLFGPAFLSPCLFLVEISDIDLILLFLACISDFMTMSYRYIKKYTKMVFFHWYRPNFPFWACFFVFMSISYKNIEKISEIRLSDLIHWYRPAFFFFFFFFFSASIFDLMPIFDRHIRKYTKMVLFQW